MGKNDYPQVFLEECKYIVKENKLTRHITKDLEFFPDESNKSDQEYNANSSFNTNFYNTKSESLNNLLGTKCSCNMCYLKKQFF